MNTNKGYINIYSIEDLNIIIGFLKGEKINGLNSIEKNSFEKVENFIRNYKINISGFVIGNEFCEHMYISLTEIKNLINQIDSKYEIIIQTSILTIYNQDYYNKLFTFLKGKNIKIIINDIGFIDLIKSIDEFSPMIILGRLLTKTRKVFDLQKKEDKYLFNSFETEEYKKYMNLIGASSLGLDILPQGNNVEKYENKYLYFPWGYYTSSRGCFTNSTLMEKSHVHPVTKCDGICKKNYFTTGKEGFLGRGNVIFYNSSKYIDKDIINFKNFILQPFLPK